MASRRLKKSEEYIRWIEKHTVVPEGKYVGRPLKVASFMREDFAAIFDNPAGTRRAILTRGRKNAKTAEADHIVPCRDDHVAFWHGELQALCGPHHQAKRQAERYGKTWQPKLGFDEREWPRAKDHHWNKL